MVWRSSVRLSVRPSVCLSVSHIMSTQYLEKFMSDNHSTWYEDWSWSVDDPNKFEVTRSNVKVTVPFNAKTMSAQYLEKFMSVSHGTW